MFSLSQGTGGGEKETTPVPHDLSQLSSRWLTMALSSVDTGSDFSLVLPEAHSQTQQPLSLFLFAGGSAGVISRTLTAPFERMKILKQLKPSSSFTSQQLFKYVWAKEGWRGLWAGNGANVVRVFPFSGIVCLSYSRVG